MNCPTRRKQLITQMRDALTILCDPRSFEEDGQITFEIADTPFSFTEEDLEEIQT
ncbi:MAG: hypothetical protein GY714_01485 [Desulfobacterales bacterium]|nr:hypothetical protein [Desulfobacterales bacterium]